MEEDWGKNGGGPGPLETPERSPRFRDKKYIFFVIKNSVWGGGT